MKKLLYLSGILLLFLSMVQPATAGPIYVTNPQTDPPPSLPDDAYDNTLFLPSIMAPLITYTVSGQIKDANDKPVSGASVSVLGDSLHSDSLEQTVTNANGVYTLIAERGDRQIQASKAGYQFDPTPAWVNLNQNRNNVNFSSGAACSNPVPNPSFETFPFYWNPISGNANGYTPYYATALAHTGLRSGFTGIPPGCCTDRESWSRWRTHEITIPADATSADLALYYWPQSNDTLLLPDKKAPDLAGLNADAEHLPTFFDAQYIQVLDTNNNYLSGGQLMWARSNAQAWLYTGPLSLLAWKGMTIKLEFGVYNDGGFGVTSAFFDDVVVTVCDGAVLPGSCSNLLTNSNFEAPGTGWTIRPATTPSSYATSFFYSPSTSMLSGIPVGTPPPQYGFWRTGEFFQEVTIPANATSAILKVRLLPRSSDLCGYHLEEQAALDSLLASPNAPEAAESQYGYICTNCSDLKNPITLGLLFRWFPIDSQNWLYREFNLMVHKGTTVGILFGAQDFGDGGNTALYVDDAVLDVCTPTAP
jgi:hypothetical protein